MRFLLTFFILPFLFTPAFSQESPSAQQLANFLKKFPQADANEDGLLSREEAVAYRKQIQAERKNSSRKGKASAVAPTHADVAYGEHERHRFDVWLPEKSADGLPFPLLLFFHGGGFVSGDKRGFDPAPYLKSGIACASSNYRYVDGETTFVSDSLADATLALQILKHRAKEWNLDPGRFAISGSSAGAVIAMYLGYSDDLAVSDSQNPIEQESTRVACLIPLNGPTNLLPSWIQENLGGPKHVHGSFPKMFGARADQPLSEEVLAAVKKASPWEHIDAEDPPTLLIYSGPLDEVPLPENTSTGKLIHHPYFGKALKERLDSLGVETEFRYDFDPRGTDVIPSYLRSQFGMVD